METELLNEIQNSIILTEHKVELKEMVFTVLCDCGRSFRAEDFEPECPFCDRKYIVEIEGNSKHVKLLCWCAHK